MNNRPIKITTDSVCDLPRNFLDHYGITIFNYLVLTEKGRFIDNREIGWQDLLDYAKDPDNMVKSSSPSGKEYRRFFEKQTEDGCQLIHIAMGKNSGTGYSCATRAARDLPVTVFDSGSLSSTMGIIAMRAAELVLLGKSKDEIIKELTEFKRMQYCSFIVKDADCLYRNGKLSRFVLEMSDRFLFRPVLKMRNSGIHTARVVAGEWEHSMLTYISSVLQYRRNIDERYVFITHVGLSEAEVDFIREEVLKRVPFQEVIVVNASAAISCNCGEGTFGILFAKGKPLDVPEYLYPIGLYEEKAEEVKPERVEKVEPLHNEPEVIPEIHQTADEKKQQLIMQLAFLDVPSGLMYCADNLDLYLEILREYIHGNKNDQLNKYLNTEDWEDYRITVHALKSGSKTIGAMELYEESRLLEQAVKDKDLEYVRENHNMVMLHYNEVLSQIREVIDL